MRTPKLLVPGDTVAIVSTARKVLKEVSRQLLPPVVPPGSSADKFMSALKGQKDWLGRDRSFTEMLFDVFLGIKLRSVDFTEARAKKLKEYKLPSGKILYIQGYENYVLDILLKSYNEEDILNHYYFDYYNFDQEIQTKFSATNFKLGAFYQLGLLGRVAATISTPVKISATETWNEYEEQIEDNDSPYENWYDSDGGTWDYELQSSWNFSAGAALTMLPNIVLSADIEYNDWSQMRYTSEPPEGNKYRKNLNFKENYHATATIRLGGEFTVPLLNTQLRAGVIRQPSPLKYAPTEADRNFITLGCGILLDKQVKFDVAYVHGWWQKDDTYLSDYFNDITEKIEIDKIFATMSIRF